jgi:hypothetical protein
LPYAARRSNTNNRFVHHAVVRVPGGLSLFQTRIAGVGLTDRR